LNTYDSGSLFFTETSVWIWNVHERIDDFLLNALIVEFTVQTQAVAVFPIVNGGSHIDVQLAEIGVR
jgi:hypothetical protein